MSNVTAAWRQLLPAIPRQQYCKYAISSKDRSPPADAVLRPQPTLRTDEGLLRVREHGNSGLPLSPLLNFERSGYERKNADHKPKLLPESMSDFQKELANNPFAHALATPVRQCNITLSRLPSHFLLPLSSYISRDEQDDTRPNRPPRVTATIHPGHSSQHAAGMTLPQHSYVLNREDLVKHLSRKSRWQHTLSERQKKSMGSLTQRNWQNTKFVKEYWTWKVGNCEARAFYENEVLKAVQQALESLESVDESIKGLSGFGFTIWLRNDEQAGANQVAAERNNFCNLNAIIPLDRVSALARRYPAHVDTRVLLPAGPSTTNLRMALERLHQFKCEQSNSGSNPKWPPR